MNTLKFRAMTPGQIKAAKEKIDEKVVSKEDIAQKLLAMKPWEYFVVPENCRIIPAEFGWSERFKKTADYKKLLTLPRDEAMAARLRPKDSLDTKLSGYKGDERGYGWVGNRNNTLRLVPLVVAYDGIELLLNAEQDIAVERYGRHARFNVPSRKNENVSYNGELLTIPFGDVKDTERAKTKYADWIDLDLRCSCEDEAFMGALNNKRAIPETRACAHSVAAYKKLKLQQVRKRNPVSIDPFAFPTEKAHELIKKMRNNVIRVYRNGNDELVQRNLLVGEQEVLLSTLASKLGFRRLFAFDNSVSSINYCRKYMQY